MEQYRQLYKINKPSISMPLCVSLWIHHTSINWRYALCLLWLSILFSAPFSFWSFVLRRWVKNEEMQKNKWFKSPNWPVKLVCSHLLRRFTMLNQLLTAVNKVCHTTKNTGDVVFVFCQETENVTDLTRFKRQVTFLQCSNALSDFLFVNLIHIKNTEHTVGHANENLIPAVSVLSSLLRGLVAKIPPLWYLHSAVTHLKTLSFSVLFLVRRSVKL